MNLHPRHHAGGWRADEISYYFTKPFTQELDWVVNSINLDLGHPLARAVPVKGTPCALG